MSRKSTDCIIYPVTLHRKPYTVQKPAISCKTQPGNQKNGILTAHIAACMLFSDRKFRIFYPIITVSDCINGIIRHLML